MKDKRGLYRNIYITLWQNVVFPIKMVMEAAGINMNKHLKRQEAQDSYSNTDNIPKSLLELLVFILKNIWRNLPYRLLWAVITGLAVLIINIYLLVVVNDGFRAEGNKLLNYIVAVDSNGQFRNAVNLKLFNVSLFWLLVCCLFWGTISHLRYSGIKLFILSVINNLVQLIEDFFSRPSSFILSVFLGGILSGFATGFLLENPVVGIALSLVIFLSVGYRKGSFILLVIYLAWCDLQRFSRTRPKKPFYIDIVSTALRGMSLGLLIFSIFPYERIQNSRMYLLGFLILLFIVNIVLRKKFKTAYSIFLTGIVVLFSSRRAFADDGGWQESGGTLMGWLRSEGAPEAFDRSVHPALWCASMALGFVPILGDAKDFQEAVTGTDLVTGEKLSPWERILTAGAVFVPVVSGKLLRTAVDGVSEAAKFTAKNSDEIAGFAAKNSGEAAGFAARNSNEITEAAARNIHRFVETDIGKYTMFLDKQDAVDWGNEAFKSWQKSLSKEELHAIYDYTGDNYRNINDVLRGFEKNFNEGNAKRVEQITEALNKTSVPDDIIVYRGVGRDALGEYKDLSPKQLIGKKLEDRGFMSTSIDPEGAFHTKVTYVIKVPKGTSGAYISNISQYGEKEAELLLNRGQKMMILDAVQKGKRLEVICEIIPKN